MHLNELELLFDQLPSKPTHTLFGICGTWLNQTNESLYAPTGFCMIPKSWEGKGGGGVALIVSFCTNYTVRSYLSLLLGDTGEGVFVDISSPNVDKGRFIICETSRPPKKPFHKFLASLLLVLGGDFYEWPECLFRL